MSLFINNERGPLFFGKIYDTKWPLFGDVPLRPHSVFHYDLSYVIMAH